MKSNSSVTVLLLLSRLTCSGSRGGELGGEEEEEEVEPIEKEDV